MKIAAGKMPTPVIKRSHSNKDFLDRLAGDVDLLLYCPALKTVEIVTPERALNCNCRAEIATSLRSS